MKTNSIKSILFLHLALLATLCVIVTDMQAQVNVGSLNRPANGALLDLKENNNNGANSKKGLLLPRVNLTELGKLYPMFQPGYNSDEDAKHIGLLVYNVATNSSFSPGIYVWTGSIWRRISH